MLRTGEGRRASLLWSHGGEENVFLNKEWVLFTTKGSSPSRGFVVLIQENEDFKAKL
jgi:hypothetical protein